MGKANTLVFEYTNMRMIFDYSKFEYFLKTIRILAQNNVFLCVLSNFVILRNFGKIIYDYSKKYNGTLGLAEFRKEEKLLKRIRRQSWTFLF